MLRISFLVGALSAVASAQATNYVITAGYAFPEPMLVAPGQVITLFVRGLNVDNAAATTDPLPVMLGGVAVVVKYSPASGYPAALPILSVLSDANACGGGLSAFCDTTAVNVQIPYEPTCIRDNFPNSCTIGARAPVRVAIQANGSAGQEFSYFLGGAPHFLNSCDSIFGRPSGECVPSVIHSDGSSVRWASPAHPGEVITIYAVGLGQTQGGARTGKASPIADRLPGDLYLTPAFLMNTSTTSNFTVSSQNLKADWAGLAKGFVGLYQINVQLPDSFPAGMQPCPGNGNLRLLLGPSVSQDAISTDVSVDVCVAR